MVAKKPSVLSVKTEETYLMALKSVQKNELKHTSTKPLAPLHASEDPANVRKISPAIQHSLRPTASVQQKDGLLRPVTPDVQDGLVPVKPILGYETTKAIQAALVVFSKNLAKLNSKVVVSDDMRYAGLILLEEAVRADKELYALTLASSQALLAASAAALWVAIKFIGVRVTSPNGALMSQASQVLITNLVSHEAQLLVSLEWGISAVLRSKGIAMG
ncbi:hypothetical protein Ndes2526B_g04387 [Nannochloris sp. 'desiccata']|nr:hypothetical protein KSW81_000856 [Chlorella desiccata (nom. nud.)]KAH7620467.1 hypothetical protein NADE_003089 [Chlorella desiccata (nom. nud.)]